ncbi:MAG: hypothetical protein P4K83_10250 [Terracidiphilus sp.]|nr:hypothetical protein [Terracidiphilus sp.]
MKKIASALLFLMCASTATLFAQAPYGPGYPPPPPGATMAAPPPPVAERRGPPPSREFVWVAGYQRWDGRAYAWVPGHYERPPRPRAVWVPHRWQHRHGGWVMIEGHWR